jgi:hypothetical protein
MLKTEFRAIQLAEVDWNDTTCLISYGPCPEKLSISIQAVGLLQQPLLQCKEDGFLQIVCGSRRLEVCRKLGLEPLPCQVLPRPLPPEACLPLAIHENVSQRRLNPVEKSLALTKLAHYIPRSQLLEEFMPLLDLEPSVTILKRYQRLSTLEPVILDGVAGGRLSERSGFALTDLKATDRLAFFHLFEELPFSASMQEELIDVVVEIARRDKLTPAQVLEGEREKELRRALNRPARQRAQDLRGHLQTRRAPRLGARKERFAREVKELGLPAGIRLVPPPFFEGPQWRLECTFKSADELAGLLRPVTQLAGQPAFQRIMERK